MKKSGAGKSKKLATMSVLTLAAWGAVGCQNEPAPFDPRAMQRLERDNANTADLPPKRELPPDTLEPARREDSTTRPTAGDAGDYVRMPLREVIQRAVANNSQVKVAGYEPGIEEARITEAEARFDPNFFIRGQYDNQFVISPNTQSSIFPTDPFNPQNFRTLSGATGLTQLLENGGEISAEFRTSRTQRDFGAGAADPTVDPFYANDLILRLNQPLLRDFGSDINRARITIAQNNQRISLLEFRQQLEELLANVEEAYWQLVQAQREVAYQNALLTRTIDTYNILYERARQGVDVSRIQVSLARQSTESRRAVLGRARARVLDLSAQLKRLMNDADFPVSGTQVVLPAHGALVEPIEFDTKEQVDTALENRPELAQQLARIDSARITQRVARNNELPQLSLTGQLDFQGVGDDVGEALDSQNDFDYVGSSIGLEFQIPIGNRAALAISRRSRLQTLQSMEQYRNLIAQVSLDVDIALREIGTSWDEIVDRRRARLAAEDALGAIQERKNAGEPLTPTFGQLELDTQQQLTNAQAEEAGAISNYNIAISRLERAKGTLLRYNNVVMEEQPLERSDGSRRPSE